MSANATVVGPAVHPPLVLLVHEASVLYVRPVVAFVRRQLALHAGRAPAYLECTEVAQYVPAPGSVVFVVGDGFSGFTRVPGCHYVFVNFSLVRRLRWWRPASPAALRWMHAKRRALLAKRGQFDMVLDFHPRQSQWLKDALAPVRVAAFATAVEDARCDAPPVPLAERRWDVGFTGTESPRRARLRAQLEGRGLAVSPAFAPGFDTVVHQSRLVLNVHFAACDTLEAPRVVHTLTAGVCLVTEPCLGLADVAPPSCYVTSSYGRIADTVTALLQDTQRIEGIARAAASHMRAHHAPRARESWRAIVRDALELQP